MSRWNVAIVGSRDGIPFQDVRFVIERMAKTVVVDGETLKVAIISGGARGVDKVATNIAMEKGFETTIFYPEWEKYGKSAGFIRNKLIVQAANEVVGFINNYSKGTANTLKLAANAGKNVIAYVYEDGVLTGIIDEDQVKEEM